MTQLKACRLRVNGLYGTKPQIVKKRLTVHHPLPEMERR